MGKSFLMTLEKCMKALNQCNSGCSMKNLLAMLVHFPTLLKQKTIDMFKQARKVRNLFHEHKKEFWAVLGSSTCYQGVYPWPASQVQTTGFTITWLLPIILWEMVQREEEQ